MTLGQCDEVELLIDREARGWTDAERLLVEQHLQGCEACLENLTLARVARETILAAPHELSESARGRVIERALASDRRSLPVMRGRRSLFVLSAAGVAAAAAATFLLVGRPVPQPVAQRTTVPVVQPVEGAAQSATLEIEASVVEVRQLAHARVELAAGTRIRFDQERSTIALECGQVNVDVDVSEGRPFRVSTSQFRVEVLGTQFTVTPDTVRVARGHVQVFGLDGSVLARDLSAGASFSYGTPATPGEGVAEPGLAGSPSEISESPSSPAAPSAHALLARAREALSRNNTRGARELVERAERSDPRRSDLAEASTLRAEVALLERDMQGALRSYLLVASRYADLAAGENAAFAAAQLAARAEPGRERELLNRYLERYPRGRFVAETRKRLGKLSRAE